jgi:hypothetical protein
MVRIDTALVAARLAANWGAIFPTQQETSKKQARNKQETSKKKGMERMNRVVAR